MTQTARTYGERLVITRRVAEIPLFAIVKQRTRCARIPLALAALNRLEAIFVERRAVPSCRTVESSTDWCLRPSSRATVGLAFAYSNCDEQPSTSRCHFLGSAGFKEPYPPSIFMAQRP